MTEFKHGSVTIRMHGTPDRQKVEAATAKLVKTVMMQRLKRGKEQAVENTGNPRRAV